jgi:predicted dehydrogenase
VAAATLIFAMGAIGLLSSTCLLAWCHQTALHLYAESLAVELSEFDLTVATGQGRYRRAAEGDATEREDRDFVDAVQGKPSRIRAPYHEALRTHRLACAVDRSAREGWRIELGHEDPIPDRPIVDP